VQYYQEAALRGAFKQSVLTLWVRVPVRLSSDAHGRGMNNFVPAVSREIKIRGWVKFDAAIAVGWRAARMRGSFAESIAMREKLGSKRSECSVSSSVRAVKLLDKRIRAALLIQVRVRDGVKSATDALKLSGVYEAFQIYT
jgi:hypothetical protein